jgi:hypothetical protein
MRAKPDGVDEEYRRATMVGETRMVGMGGGMTAVMWISADERSGRAATR